MRWRSRTLWHVDVPGNLNVGFSWIYLARCSLNRLHSTDDGFKTAAATLICKQMDLVSEKDLECCEKEKVLRPTAGQAVPLLWRCQDQMCRRQISKGFAWISVACHQGNLQTQIHPCQSARPVCKSFFTERFARRNINHLAVLTDKATASTSGVLEVLRKETSHCHFEDRCLACEI